MSCSETPLPLTDPSAIRASFRDPTQTLLNTDLSPLSSSQVLITVTSEFLTAENKLFFTGNS